MAMISKATRWAGAFLFVVYLLLLTRSILFKKGPRYYRQYFRSGYKHYSVKEGWAKANTVPFATINRFYNSRHLSAEYKQDNLLGNLVGFIPFGFFLPFLIPWFRHSLLTGLAGFGLSCFYEFSQLYFGLGVFDVDDMLLNTAGTLIGYFVFRLLRFGLYRFAREEKPADS